MKVDGHTNTCTGVFTAGLFILTPGNKSKVHIAGKRYTLRYILSKVISNKKDRTTSCDSLSKIPNHDA